MMNIEDFRNMFRAHLSHEIWDKWRKGQLDVSRRRNTPDGCEYEELPKEAADQILDFGQLPKRDQNRYTSEVFKAFTDARKEMKCGSERKS